MERFTIGSVSEGTLRPEDLIPVFEDVLGEANGLTPHGIRTAFFNESDSENDYLNTLFNELNNQAPLFTYFGSAEGDGACFGFWIDHEYLDEAIHSQRKYNADALYLEDDNVWVKVSDHGNVTLFTNDNGKPAEVIWAVV
jgi:hypothetical protein